MKDITPDGSVVPIYLEPLTHAQKIKHAKPPGPSLDEKIQAQQALCQSGIDKLIALGLTEAEALAIAGA